MIRVVVVDDQEVVRAGLCRILDQEADLEVAGTAADGLDAVDLVSRTRPDVCLMDVRMPRLDGLAATQRIVASAAPTRVLVLTTFDLDEYVYRALAAGASGFVLKDAPADELVQAVRLVSAGDSAVLAGAPTRRLIEQFAQRHRSRPLPGSPLTEREHEVLVAMAHGMSNAEVGARLFISEGTVRTHVARLLAKLGVRDRLQAVVLAYECGVVEPGHTGQDR